MSAIDGTWNLVVKSPIGEQKSVLTLKTDGDVVTGTSASPTGTLEILDGKLEGDRFTWKMNMKSPMAMTLEGDLTFSGDTVSGKIKAGAFGNQSASGSRAS